MLRLLLTVLFFLLFSLCLHAQVKTIQAVKTKQPPKIDGILNDEAWKQAPVATDFIVGQPKFGDTASKKTEVRIIYTDEAVYIAAHIYDDPKLISRKLTMRDEEEDVDVFGVGLDTYLDKQNGFYFAVTSADVQSDAKISSNQTEESSGTMSTGSINSNSKLDYSWDAVWNSKVTLVADGWIVEMRIPFMSLRFSKNETQDWGLNFYRFIRRLNESDYWNPINPKIAGQINQSGVLQGLKNLEPPLRLSFLPYISTGFSTVPTNNGHINSFIHNGGMDVKYGVNQSFTMDMTLIPDFGQTQSDNVVLNLTPYELQFQENRPFFTEGTELFNKAGIFYSRRVGRTPRLYDSINTFANDSGYTIIRNPSLTQLYNATKFSGRTKDNIGIGIFNAVSASENAVFIDNNGKRRIVETEPLSNYNIIVFDKALKNRSSITFTNTNVLRKNHERNANVSAIDYSLFDKNNNYNFQLKGRYSNVSAGSLKTDYIPGGGTEAHDGFKTSASFGKVSGLWQWDVSNSITSEKYDPNDIGYLHNPNEVVTAFNIAYKQFEPDKHYNSRNYSLGLLYRNLYKPFAFREFFVNIELNHVYKNFWESTFLVLGNPNLQYDYFELRTEGRKMKRWPWTFFAAGIGTDSRQKFLINPIIGYAVSYNWPEYMPFYFLDVKMRYRFNNKFSMNLNAHREIDPMETGFAFFEPLTNEPVIGKRYTQRMEAVLSGNYNFRARMNLSVKLRHFWSNVHYKNFYHVSPSGEYLSHETAYQTGYDENYNAFNVDAFYTWDFMPGSRLIIAWKNAIGPDVSIDGSTYSSYFKNFSQTLIASHSNQLSVKFVYFIDYNRLSKKKK